MTYYITNAKTNMCICVKRKQHRRIRVYVFGLYEYTFNKTVRQGDHAKPFIYILTNKYRMHAIVCVSLWRYQKNNLKFMKRLW